MRSPLPVLGKRTGFTLIELMVVVVIIGILAAIAIPAYTNAQRAARTARERGDIKAIQNAQEVLFSQTGAYSNNTGTLTFSSGSFPTPPNGSSLTDYTSGCTYTPATGTGAKTAYTCTYTLSNGDSMTIRNLQ